MAFALACPSSAAGSCTTGAVNFAGIAWALLRGVLLVADALAIRRRLLTSSSGAPGTAIARIYNRLMAMEFVAQRLEIGDVVLLDLGEGGGKVEATVVRTIDRTDTTVRATVRVEGREDFLKEWSLDELVTVVRGP
jgi:hypothetical protein